MCIPCGPRWRGSPGRTAFHTLDDILSFPLKQAKEKYPNNDAALEKIKAYIVENIEHTTKWMINDLYLEDIELARIGAIEENRVLLKKFYSAEKKKLKNS